MLYLLYYWCCARSGAVIGILSALPPVFVPRPKGSDSYEVAATPEKSVSTLEFDKSRRFNYLFRLFNSSKYMGYCLVGCVGCNSGFLGVGCWARLSTNQLREGE